MRVNSTSLSGEVDCNHSQALETWMSADMIAAPRQQGLGNP